MLLRPVRRGASDRNSRGNWKGRSNLMPAVFRLQAGGAFGSPGQHKPANSVMAPKPIKTRVSKRLGLASSFGWLRALYVRALRARVGFERR